MERTADRCALTFEMTSTSSLRATRALVRRRSSCSRQMLRRHAFALAALSAAVTFCRVTHASDVVELTRVFVDLPDSYVAGVTKADRRW